MSISQTNWNTVNSTYFAPGSFTTQENAWLQGANGLSQFQAFLNTNPSSLGLTQAQWLLQVYQTYATKFNNGEIDQPIWNAFMSCFEYYNPNTGLFDNNTLLTT